MSVGGEWVTERLARRWWAPRVAAAPRRFSMAWLALRASLLPLVLVGFDLTVRSVFTVHVHDRWRPTLYAVALLSSFGLALAVLSLASLLAERSSRLARGLVTIVAGLYALVLFANVHVYRYFGEYVFPSALDFLIHDRRYIIDYLVTYGTFGPALAAALAFLALGGLLTPPRFAPSARLPRAFLGLAGVMAFAGGLRALERETDARLPPDVVTFVSVSKHLVKVGDATRPLRPTERLAVHAVPSPPLALPHTVVVIVNESMGIRGIDWLGAPGAGTPRLAERMRRTPERFVRFQRAFTSAGATAVSMASLFSGVSPEESYEKLHRMPMLWDLAKARGYRTAYVTSQRLRWACLSDFLLAQPIDVKRSVENLESPIVNDMGIDDQVSAREVVRLFEETPRDVPLFVLYNTNALHAPFQDSSAYVDVSRVPGGRYEKALALVDAAVETLFEGLARSGRLDDAWVLSTSDHGETPEPTHGVPRISSFFDEIVRVPAWSFLPSSWAADAQLMAALRHNELSPVSNVDLVPTVAAGLGVEPIGGEGDPWKGSSWLTPVPAGRVLTVLNTNETRLWDREGFGLVRGDARLVCHVGPGCQLFFVDDDPGQTRDRWAEPRARTELPELLRVVESSPELGKVWAHYRREVRPLAEPGEPGPPAAPR